jgi:drug/metabolite transporter (DMT)-like permease
MPAALIWLPASLLAGLVQAWRTAVQQRLRAQLSVNGAGLVRYFYGTPWALLMAWLYVGGQAVLLPLPGGLFWLLAGLGGLAQILGTNLLILAFGYRNFVVGTAFAKTEAVQAALFAWIVLGERLGGLALAGVLAGVSGVLLLALGGGGSVGGALAPAPWRGLRWSLAALRQPAALCGLGAGLLFAVTSVLVKSAIRSVPLADPVAGALLTLAVVNNLQLLMQGGYVAWREPATLGQLLLTWRVSAVVGVLAALGSACWFIGFATGPVALVRIVGQVEVVFTLAFARLYLGERTRRYEAVGLLLVSLGVILALTGSLI